MTPNKVIHPSRQIIEHKLLTALEDEDTVAILASRQDLDLLIRGLRYAPTRSDHERERLDFWLKSMEQLRKETFG